MWSSLGLHLGRVRGNRWGCSCKRRGKAYSCEVGWSIKLRDFWEHSFIHHFMGSLFTFADRDFLSQLFCLQGLHGQISLVRFVFLFGHKRKNWSGTKVSLIWYFDDTERLWWWRAGRESWWCGDIGAVMVHSVCKADLAERFFGWWWSSSLQQQISGQTLHTPTGNIQEAEGGETENSIKRQQQPVSWPEPNLWFEKNCWLLGDTICSEAQLSN